jgi:hypothetical protein
MKNNLICFLLLLFTFNFSYCQGVDKVLRKYKNDQGVSAMSFASNINQLIKNNKVEFKSVISECEVLVFNTPNDINKTDKEKLKAAVKAEAFDELLSVKDKRGSAKLYAVGKGETLSKVFAMLSYDKKNIYLTFKGKIYFDELSKMNFFFDRGNQLTDILNSK